ncbi:MAG: transketolase C-terminal domain-containing protein [Bacilli bacterium]|jgi:transketolase
MIKLMNEFRLDDKEMRSYYSDALIEAGEKDMRIVAVDADVAHSMGTLPFYKRFPDRAVNCGIMEAHMVGFAAGLSAAGYVPFVHAFATFATRRAFDQLFLAAGYQKLNVKVIGGDAGVTASSNGGTHMPFEDLALVRAIPNFIVIEPADGSAYRQLIPYAAKTYGNFYIRSTRKKTMRLYDQGTDFVVGKANLLKKGTDVAVIACGLLVYEALMAAQTLEKEGISVRVIDMFTIKPIDEEAIVRAARECRAIVTAENHNVIGGLGSAVDDVVTANFPVPVAKIGIHESFGEVGTQDYLMERFQLTSKHIIVKIKEVLARKLP